MQPVHTGTFVSNILNPRQIPRNIMLASLPTSGGTAIAGETTAVTAAKAGGGVIKSVVNAGKTAFQRLTTNPLAGQTLKGAAKKLGLGTLGALGTYEAFNAAQSVGAGEKYNPFKNIGSKVQVAAASAFNPIAAYLGLGSGLVQRGIEKTKENLPQNLGVDLGQGTKTEFHFPEFPAFPEFPNPSINVTTPEMPQMPSGYASGGFSPSVSVGGGGDNLPLLLLLLGGLGVGAAVIAHKRKKKKYKKRQRR